MHSDWQVITGDNRVVIPMLEGVTHFVTDPPYDEKTHASAKTSKTESAGRKVVQHE